MSIGRPLFDLMKPKLNFFVAMSLAMFGGQKGQHKTVEVLCSIIDCACFISHGTGALYNLHH